MQKFILIVFLYCYLTTSALASSLDFLDYKNGKLDMPVLSKQEFEYCLSLLKRVSQSYVPTGFVGGELIDVSVSKYLGKDRFGQRKYSVRVFTNYTGDLVQGVTVTLYTPQGNEVLLVPTKKYRIFAYDFNKLREHSSPKYFFWKGGVLEL